tara:strand:- start:2202 stop:2417 length:216 start_codon:yes stop_codon:yes gene_type:complete
MSNVDSSVEEVNKKTVSIPLDNIRTMVNIIDISSQRGAFRAPEMKGVGEFYEQLVALVPNELQKEGTQSQQ